MIFNCTTNEGSSYSWKRFYTDSMPIVEYQEKLFGCTHSRLCLNDYGDISVVNVRSVEPVGGECTKNITSIIGLITHRAQTYFNRETRPIFGFEDKFWSCIEGFACPEGVFDSEHEPADDGLSAGAIAGIVFAGVVTAGLAGAAVGLCLRRWRSPNRGNENHLNQDNGQQYELVEHGELDNDHPAIPPAPPLPPLPLPPPAPQRVRPAPVFVQLAYTQQRHQG